MDENFVKNLISVQFKIKNACEGFQEQKNKPVILSNKLRLLLILSQTDRISPTTIVPMLSVAKSNLNLLCTKMIGEKLIDKVVDDYDRRIIYYKITTKGERELNTEIALIVQNLNKYFKTDVDKSIIEMIKKINDKLD